MLNYIKTHPFVWHLLAYLVISVALFLSFQSYKGLTKDVAHFSVELRNGLVTSCEKNGNPLRTAIQTLLKQDIEASKRLSPDEYALLFPNFPREQLDALIAQGIKEKEALLASVPDVDCQELYPPPPTIDD